MLLPGGCLFVLGPLTVQWFDLVLELVLLKGYVEMLLECWLSRCWNSTPTFTSFLHQKIDPPRAELGSSETETGLFNHHIASQQPRLCRVEVIGKQIQLLCKCKWHKNSSPLKKETSFACSGHIQIPSAFQFLAEFPTFTLFKSLKGYLFLLVSLWTSNSFCLTPFNGT